MNQRRNLFLHCCLLAALTCSLSLFSGCTEKPDAPVFNNVFDPLGPENGDPFQVQAFISGADINVAWTAPEGFDIATYRIRHSTDGETYLTAGEIPAPAAMFTFSEGKPTATNYFTIQAIDALGEVSIASHVVAAELFTPPFLVIGDGDIRTAERYVTLSLETSVPGQYVIANNAAFTDGDTLTAPADSVLQVEDYDLGAATVDGDTMKVFTRVLPEVSMSLPDAGTFVLTRFDPAFSLVDDQATVADVAVDLTVEAAGLTRARFAMSEEELADATWLDVPADSDSLAVFESILIDENINIQTVHGEFENDFGYTTTNELEIVPDDLTSATFQFVDGEITASPEPMLACDAVATEMRFAEEPDFTDAAWIEYSPTTLFPLSAGGGEKTIYGQFRNHWNDSAPLTATVLLVSVPLYVGFTAPLDSMVITGGEQFTVEGRAYSSDEQDPITDVYFDAGDGEGFLFATGTSNWNRTWDVPLLTEDTERSLRARVRTATDSTFATVLVTISQLVVTITEPAAGATNLDPDTDLTISGTAHPHLQGDPIDLVALTCDGELVEVFETDAWATWSATWHIPADSAGSSIDLVATVLAGDQSANTTVTISVASKPRDR